MGGGTARTETFDGGIGRSVYDGVEHMDAQGEQEGIQAYKTIRTGVDEMNFVMLEDVNQPIETGTVLVSRGGTGTRADDRTDSRTISGDMDRHGRWWERTEQTDMVYSREPTKWFNWWCCNEW